MGKRGPKTEEGRMRALANLKPFKKGYVVSNAYRIPPQEAIAEKMRELEAILQGDASGWLKRSDEVAVGLLARCLVRIEMVDRAAAVDRWLRGQVTGNAKLARQVPAYVQVYLRLLEQAHKLCDSLGLTPRARGKLGLSTTQTLAFTEILQAMTRDESAGAEPNAVSGEEQAVSAPREKLLREVDTDEGPQSD